MGCGGSKLEPAAGDEVPVTIRPLLRRRLEEIKKRSHASVLKGTQTSSKKELLKHGSSDGEETENDVVPLEENKEVIYEEIPGENNIREEEEGEEKEDKNGLREEKIIEGVRAGKIEEQEKGMMEDEIREDRGKKGKEEDEEEGEEGRLSNFDESMICPGSPSFRVYCTDALESGKDDEGKDEKTNKRAQIEDSSEGINSNEGPTEKMEKKGKKGKKGLRLGRVLPKGAPGTYLFNVRSCYSPGCMGNHHSRLVEEKSMV